MLPYAKEECEVVRIARYAVEVGEMGMMVLKWVRKVTPSKQEAKGRAVRMTYVMKNSNKCSATKLMVVIKGQKGKGVVMGKM